MYSQKPRYILRNYEGTPQKPDEPQIAPGCFFLRYDKRMGLVLYGLVLDFEQVQDGAVPTLCWTRGMQAMECMSPIASMSQLLGATQIELARSLHWPTDEHSLMTIFNVPSN